MGSAAESSGGKLSGLASHLGTLAVAAAGVGAVMEGKKFLGESAAAAEELAGAVGKMQRVMGGTAEDASRLKFALGETGVSSDSAIRSIDKFSKGLNGLIENEDGTTTKSNVLTKQLEGMGIVALDTSGKQRSMNDILADTADKFKEMPNGAEKTALAMQLFGKSGVDLIPFLNKGAEGIAELSKESDKFGLTLSQNTIDQTKKLTMAHRELSAAHEGLKVQVGIALIPLMLQSAEVMTKVAVAVNGLLVPGIQHATRVLLDMHGFVMDALHGWGSLTTVIGDAAGGHHRLLAVLMPVATALDFLTAKGRELALTLKGELSEAITTRFLPALQSVVTILQSFSGGVIGTLITAVQLLISHWGELTKQFPILQVAVDNLKVVWAEQLQPALERVGAFIQGTLLPAIIAMGPTVLALADNVKQLITGALQVIVPLLEQFFGQFSKNQLLIAAGVAVGLLVTALFPLPVAITAIVAGLALLYTHWGDVTGRLKDFADLVNQRFPEIGKFISQVQTFFDGLATFVTERFWPAVRTVIEEAVSFIRDHWGQIESLLRGPFEIARAAITGVLLQIKDVISTTFAVIGDVLAIFGDLFKGNWGKLWGDVKTLVNDVWTGIKQFVKDYLDGIVGILKGAWDTIKASALVAWDAIRTVFEEAWTLIKRAVRAGLDTLVNWFSELPGDILSALGNLSHTLWSAGVDLVQGFVDGVKSMAGKAIGAVQDAVGGAIDWVTGHGRSPWPVTIASGKDAGQGWIDGVESKAPGAKDAVTTLIAAALGVFDNVGTANPFYAAGQAAGNLVIAGLGGSRPGVTATFEDLGEQSGTAFDAGFGKALNASNSGGPGLGGGYGSRASHGTGAGLGGVLVGDTALADTPGILAAIQGLDAQILQEQGHLFDLLHTINSDATGDFIDNLQKQLNAKHLQLSGALADDVAMLQSQRTRLQLGLQLEAQTTSEIIGLQRQLAAATTEAERTRLSAAILTAQGRLAAEAEADRRILVLIGDVEKAASAALSDMASKAQTSGVGAGGSFPSGSAFGAFSGGGAPAAGAGSGGTFASSPDAAKYAEMARGVFAQSASALAANQPIAAALGLTEVQYETMLGLGRGSGVPAAAQQLLRDRNQNVGGGISITINALDAASVMNAVPELVRAIDNYLKRLGLTGLAPGLAG